MGWIAKSQWARLGARLGARLLVGAIIAWGGAGSAAMAQDWGDAPDSYQTTNAAGGPTHGIVAGLRLGQLLDGEPDGIPSPNADGDDTSNLSDEDGVTAFTLVAGTNARFVVSVFNDTGGPARLLTWVDFDGSGTFDPGELTVTPVPAGPGLQSIVVSMPVPDTADIDTGGATYARFRLTTDGALNTPGGVAPDGEVEDYAFTVYPPGLAISITNDATEVTLGGAVTYQTVVEHSGLVGVTRTIDIPVDTARFSGVTWTCVANANASCTTGQPVGTGAAGVGEVSQSIDLAMGGEAIFTVSGVLRPDYVGGALAVTASANSGQTATDTDAVVAPAPVAVPTLGEWAMLILLAVLAAFGVSRLPRRRTA